MSFDQAQELQAYHRVLLLISSQHVSLGRIGSWFLSAAILLLCISCLYNIFLHPLSRYPGPLLAKVSPLYGAYYSWRGESHLRILKLHQLYGDYVRWTPNRLLMNTPEALHDIYRAKSNVQKDLSYSMLATPPNTLSSNDEMIHGPKKKLVSKGLSPLAIQELEAKIIITVKKLICSITNSSPMQETGQKSLREWTTPFNIARLMDCVLVEIMGWVTFGRDLDIIGNAEQEAEMEAFTQDIKTLQFRTSVLVYLPSLQVGHFDKLLFAKESLAGIRFVKRVSRWVKDRLKASSIQSGTQDALSNVIESTDPVTGEKPTRRSLISETAMLMIAGVDTSATTLSALIFYLARNSGAYCRLAAELRDAFPDPVSISLGPKLASCTYLQACIDETLRMTPPVGSLLPREILPGGAIIDDIYLPAGVSVGTGVYSIQHHASLGDPFVWRPDRWLVEDTTTLKAYFHAFSTGITACPGQPLARAEMSLLMAFLFTHFDFRSSQEGTEEEKRLGEGGWKGCIEERHRRGEYQLWDCITSAKDGPMIQFRERDLCR